MITINAVNTTYFGLAALYYGDATQGIWLMMYNGVSDPMIAVSTEVIIPDQVAPPNNGLHPLAIGQVVTLPASALTSLTGNT